MELQIEGLLIAPIIVGLIEIAKLAGLDVKYAPWLNAALSVLGYAVMMTVQSNPAWREPVVLLLNALVLFLSAAGVYDVAKRTVQG